MRMVRPRSNSQGELAAVWACTSVCGVLFNTGRQGKRSEGGSHTVSASPVSSLLPGSSPVAPTVARLTSIVLNLRWSPIIITLLMPGQLLLM